MQTSRTPIANWLRQPILRDPPHASAGRPAGCVASASAPTIVRGETGARQGGR